MPYHVRITPKSDRSHDEIKLDLTKEQLNKQFLIPYKKGNPINIKGRTIPCNNIERIRISYTEESSTQLLPIIKAERSQSRVVVIGISDEWYVTQKGIDVTDDFITMPPGQEKEESVVQKNNGIHAQKAEKQRLRQERKVSVTQQWTRLQEVFVVHGRNEKLRDSLFSFLRAIGLHPIEWIEAVNATGIASPYIGQVLDVAFDRAQAIIVLLTPDDEVKIRKEFIKSSDPKYERELTPQARPNVLFEAGMAMGINPDRTIIVEIGNLKPFSDIIGRHTIRLNNSPEKRHELALKLQTAGCNINLSDTDWRKEGDFSL